MTEKELLCIYKHIIIHKGVTKYITKFKKA